MSAAKRAKDAKAAARKGQHGGAAYATMRQDAILVAACTLSAIGLRWLMLANAAWRPSQGNGPGGKAALGCGTVERPNGATDEAGAVGFSRTTTVEARAEVLMGGWLVQIAAGARPGTAGGARGVVATFDVPHRHGADAPRVEMPPNVRRPGGKLRLHAARIRADAAALSPNAFRVLIFAAAFRDRTDEGALADPAPFPLTLAELGKRLAMPRTTAAKAIAELVAARRLALATPGTGRRAALYTLAQPYATFRRAAA